MKSIVKIGPNTFELDYTTGRKRLLSRDELAKLPPFQRQADGWHRLTTDQPRGKIKSTEPG